MDIVERIIVNVLTALYQPFGFSLLFSVVFMFFYIFAKEQGLKNVFHKWWNGFKNDSSFRRVLLLIFYAIMILFRTLLNRDMWSNPLSNVFGDWGLYDVKGKLTTVIIENLMLFIPFTILLLWAFEKHILKGKHTLLNILLQSIKYVFLFSISIEFSQLFFRLGTFQFSDLFYNTLGGLIGGIIYWIIYKIKKYRNTEL